MLASQYGHIEIVRALLAAGANVNLQDNIGKTALYYASSEGHIDIVRLLLEYGADVNPQDSGFDYTALMIASYEGHIEVVRLLLAAELLMKTLKD